jgi:Ca2+/H+ antiporter, TMEM165/GDT1 family
MYTDNKFNRGKHWAKKIGLIIVLVPLFVFVFGFVVMTLWNYTLPALFGISTITFWQAIAITILSKILFGGFHGGKGHKQSHNRSDYWKHRWKNMSEEERERYKNRWKNWCDTRWDDERKDTEEQS